MDGNPMPERRSPIDEILAHRDGQASRYGEGRRHQAERDQIREAYLALDVRLPDGTYRGFFYVDLAGGPILSADHTLLVIPFREAVLQVHGYRLVELYRAILHHSLDMLEVTHRPEFAEADGTTPTVQAIEIVEAK